MKNNHKTLTGSECYLMLKELVKKKQTAFNQFAATRNYCLALLMLDAGLRVGEATHLKVNSLMFGGQICTSVVIPASLSKNGQERTIPMSHRLQKACQAMREYWGWRSDEGTDIYAFTKTARKSSLTTRQVERIIGNAAHKAFGRRVYPHQLRHTFASRLAKRVNIRVVQQLLGHSSIQSTQIYTHPDADDLNNAIESLND